MADLHDRRVMLAAPMSGDAIALEDIPDPVFAFSSGALGNGYGVNPSSNQVVAPISGTITMIAGTKHAFGFKSNSGLEVLLHLGVDIVELEGKPFEVNVAVGDQVEAGQQLATMDLTLVKAAGKGTTAITVITNTNTHLAALTVNAGTVAAGEPAAVATLKGEAVAGASAPKERPTTPWGWISYGFSSLIGVITGSMIPVVGVLAASCILKGILALLTQFNVVASGSDTYKLITAMSDSMFYFVLLSAYHYWFHRR